MHAQPGQRSCANEAIGGNHYGPVTVSFQHYFLGCMYPKPSHYQVYMAAVSDAKTAVGSSAGWFKVSELGLVSSNPDYFGSREQNAYIVSCFTVSDITYRGSECTCYLAKAALRYIFTYSYLG